MSGRAARGTGRGRDGKDAYSTERTRTRRWGRWPFMSRRSPRRKGRELDGGGARRSCRGDRPDGRGAASTVGAMAVHVAAIGATAGAWARRTRRVSRRMGRGLHDGCDGRACRGDRHDGGCVGPSCSASIPTDGARSRRWRILPTDGARPPTMAAMAVHVGALGPTARARSRRWGRSSLRIGVASTMAAMAVHVGAPPAGAGAVSTSRRSVRPLRAAQPSLARMPSSGSGATGASSGAWRGGARGPRRDSDTRAGPPTRTPEEPIMTQEIQATSLRDTIPHSLPAWRSTRRPRSSPRSARSSRSSPIPASRRARCRRGRRRRTSRCQTLTARR